MAYNPYNTGTTNINKDVDVDVTRVDVDKDIDVNENVNKNVNVDVNVDVEKEVEYERTNRNIDIEIKPKHVHAEAYVKDVNVDVDIEKEYTTTTNTNTNTTTNTNTHTHTKTETITENWDVDVDVDAKNVIWGSDIKEYHDSDVNDIDAQNLINVNGSGSSLTMEDFSADKLAVGNSLNGSGNDGFAKADQSNELTDNDTVEGVSVSYVGQPARVPPHVDADADIDVDAKGYGKHWTANGSATLGFEMYHDVDPESAFQYGHADGDTASAGDGIGAFDGNGNASENEGDGTIGGSSSASADGIVSQAAFNLDISTGGNQQGNVLSVSTVGNNNISADDIGGGGHHGGYGARTGDDDHNGGGGNGGHGGGDGIAIRDSWVTRTFDDDVNDLDNQELINVGYGGFVDMEDFSLDEAAFGNSLNGAGNDWAYDFEQSNSLVDNDSVTNAHVSYAGPSFMPFQHAVAYGGNASAGDGIGRFSGDGNGSANGGDGSIIGTTSASGDAVIDQSAFNMSISVGANLQLNQMQIRHVGGDSTFADDITG